MAVLPAEEARFEYSVPVVVIGAGACGLTAALAARECGAETLVLERDAKPAGSTALSTGLIPAARTRFQRALGIADSPELLAEDIWRKAKGETDRAIVDAVARAAGPTIEWLADRHGVAFRLVEGFLYPGHSVLRMHGTPHRTGRELEDALLAAAGRLGIDIVTSAVATDLYASSDGRVAAVRFSRPDGAVETVGCEALVLGCCGFGGDKEMVRRHIPEIADAEFWGHVGNKGDAIKWGRALGAAIADLGSYQGHGAVATPYGNPVNWGLLTNGGYQVNLLGQRFSNEVRGYSEQAVEVIAQPGRVAWNIFDELREQPILGFTDYQQIQALGGVKKAPTLRALAALVGLPSDALEQTNAAVDALRAGAPEDRWGRSFRDSPPLAPPFCAIKVTGALFHTQGGLVIDPTARVLRVEGAPLPNLFAGGGAARGLSGPSNWGYFSGGGLLSATTLGRIAGENAARCAQ
ncbi:MAG TPA: FAD-dependent oxidoreductase [Burkholderiales bacterium]|nr:FAD-dependent oxidoreductase [Burkholderiales bacterium]